MRIKLDLTDFFNNWKKYAYILIQEEWETIKNLQDHIQKMFSLPQVELVTMEDFIYLPPRESIKVIKKGDIIKVVKQQIDLEGNVPIEKSKKRKAESNNDENEDLNETITSNAEGKKPRKRKRKNKSKNLEITEQSITNPKLLPIKINKTTSSKEHIRFDEEEETEINPKESEEKLVLVFKNYLENEDLKKPRIIKAAVTDYYNANLQYELTTENSEKEICLNGKSDPNVDLNIVQKTQDLSIESEIIVDINEKEG